MGSREQTQGVSERVARAIVYCVVPRELAAKLHEPLCRHFRDEPGVEVVVERRGLERRASDERREQTVARRLERRAIRNPSGRRVGERRAAAVAIEAPMLPRRAVRYADRLVFVERLEPSDQHLEDLDTARLVTRFQAGDAEAFPALYMRYFDRIYNYLRVAFDDAHEAEDATQQVFMKVLEALPAYERRGGGPFRAWVFTVVRNHALNELKRQRRVEATEPDALDRHRDEAHDADLRALDWVSDRELLMFIGRLPKVQQQVLLLRFHLDLSAAQIGAILGRAPDDVRGLQSRALRFLEARLTSLGRGPRRGGLIRSRGYPKYAPVLRGRRFALR